jgi:hypothetical protein
MTLFDSNSQHRENATIWRLYSFMPLFAALADGCVWRWFAVNIPMSIMGVDEFTSDIDIIARLKEPPPTRRLFCRTWEVKVGLIQEDGTTRSLKTGKVKDTMDQLRAYRKFGSPEVSLLDMIVCESGYMKNGFVVPAALQNSMAAKRTELAGQFGYQFLPIQHDKREGKDFGIRTISREPEFEGPILRVLPSVKTDSREPFDGLVAKLDAFFEEQKDKKQRSMHQIVFCRACTKLQLIRMKDEHICPNCKTEFVPGADFSTLEFPVFKPKEGRVVPKSFFRFPPGFKPS